MKDLLNLINDQKIQQMMCNPDILNSMGDKPDMNKLMNCEDLHNVVSDRDLMSKIITLSKEMGGELGNFNNMKVPTNHFNTDSKSMNLPDLDLNLNDLNIKDTKNEEENNVDNEEEIEVEKKIDDKILSDDNNNYSKECQNLMSMGFEDQDRNLELLRTYKGDIKSVLRILL